MAKTKFKLKKALKDIEEAKSLRASAQELESAPCNDPLGAKFMRMDADELEIKANKELQIPEEESPAIGTGGELTISKEYAVESPSLVNTVERPDNVTAEASRDRLQLTLDLDCTGLALDAAETIQARDSLEKMLAHQLAAAHKLAMTFAQKALDYSEKSHRDTYGRKELSVVEAPRMVNASARMMDVYQKGILALTKVRAGGKQTVIVQHVNVKDGGQAVVTGALRTGIKDENYQ